MGLVCYILLDGHGAKMELPEGKGIICVTKGKNYCDTINKVIMDDD